MSNSEQYITRLYDTDCDLLQFLTLNDIINISLANRSLNSLVENHFYQNLDKLSNRKSISLQSYRRGLLKILMKFHSNKQNIIIKNSVDIVSAGGYVEILDWLKKNGFEIKYSDRTLNLASSNGHVNILDWLLKYDPLLFLSGFYECVDLASSNGHVNVLDWFNKRKYYVPIDDEPGSSYVIELNFLYTTKAIDSASSNGHVNVLDWFNKHIFIKGLQKN